MNAIDLLIGGKDQSASNQRTVPAPPTRSPARSRPSSRRPRSTTRCALPTLQPPPSRPGRSSARPSAASASSAAADILAHAGRREFTALMVAETGATAGWAGFNVHLAEGMLREAAAMTTQISPPARSSRPTSPTISRMAFRQPVGVVLGIAPWNAPVILGVRSVAMPLACGNTVVLKASEMSPGVHRLIGSCSGEAGARRRRRQCRDQCAGGRAGRWSKR